MKKFLLRCAKKSTAFIMACVMVMTCWVFVAPEAKALDYGQYEIELRNLTTNGAATFSVKGYKFSNGVLNTTEETLISNQNLKSYLGDDNKFVCDGFPTSIIISCPGCGSGISAAGIYINGIRTGDSDNFGCADKATVYLNYDGTGYEDTGNYSYPSISWKLPTLESITVADAAIDIGTGYKDISITTKDNWGATWLGLTEENISISNENGVRVGRGTYSFANKTVRVTATTTTLGDLINAKKGLYDSENGVGSDVFTFAYEIDDYNSVSDTSTLTFKSPTYTVYFKDACNGQTYEKIHYDQCYYNGSVEVPDSVCSKAEDETNHYGFADGWTSDAENQNDVAVTDGKITGITKETYFYAKYTEIIHDFTGGYVYLGDGKHAQYCTGEGSVSGSCTAIGLFANTYKVNGKIINEEGSTAGCTGTWEANANDSTTHIKKCPTCGNKNESGVLVAESHIITPVENPIDDYIVQSATCSQPGIYHKSCKICGLQLEETFETPQKEHEYIQTNFVPAKCEDDDSLDPNGDRTYGRGYYVYRCINCGGYKVDYDINGDGKDDFPAGHQPGVIREENKIAATCETDGSYDKVTYCSVCREHYSTEKVIVQALGHKEGTPVRENEVAPTCTEDGSYDEVVYCLTCGKGLSRKEDVVDPAPGHDYKAVVTAPTCTEQGYTTYTCSRCDDSYIDDYVDATGHKEGETVVENEKAATCTETGSYDNVVYCTVCGDQISRKTVTVDKIPHTPGETEIENKVDATCTVDGSYDEVVYCSVCDTELSRTPKTIKAAHTPGEAVKENDIPSTCSVLGSYDEVVYCSVCEEELTRENKKYTELNSDNHSDYGTYLDGATTATCITPGNAGTKKCSECHAILETYDETPIDPNNHEGPYTEHAAVDPTCEADGYTAYETCDACHKELGKEVIPATGHNYVGGDAVILEGDVHAYKCLNGCGTTGVGRVKDATEACSGGTASCTEKAVCTICTDTYGGLAKHIFNGDYKYIDGTETHNRKCLNCDAYGIGETLEAGGSEACSGGTATCTEKAECIYCNTRYGEPLGHDFSASNDRVVCNDDGTHSYKCSRCDAEGAVVGGEQITGGTIACKDSEPVITPATCTTRGYTTHVCDICDYTWETDEVQPLGHAYTQKLINADHLHTAATCTESAVYWYDCARCTKNAKDETDTDKYTDLTYVYGSPAGHTFNGIDAEAEFIDEEKTIPVELVLCTPATCEDNATYYKYCIVCGVTSQGTEKQATFEDFGSAGTHSKEEIVDDAFLKSEATCTAKAVYYKSCRDCGEISDETFEYGEKLSHEFTKRITDISHRITVATCQSSATYWYACEMCNYSAQYEVTAEMTEAEIAALQFPDGDPNPDNHTSLVNVPVKNPTCLEDGYSAHQKCEACGTEIGKTVYSQIDHKYTGEYIIVNETDADNNTVYMHKRSCIYDCGEAAPATACSFSDFTQNEDGLTHSKSCICGNTVTENCSSDDEPTCTNPVNCEICGGFMSGATDHAYGDWYPAGDGKRHMRVCDNDPTHIEYQACFGGTATVCGTIACEVCSQVYKTDTHIWEESDWVVTKYPTCTAAGVETATCDACGLSETRVYGTALKHSYDAGVVIAPATCTTDGFKVYTCQRSGCGHRYLETIPALKHNMGAWEITTEPTCKDEGVQTKCCQNSWIVDGVEVKCDYTQTQTIPADKSKHVPGDWEVDEANSNCATGLKMVIKCTVCGIVIESKTEPVDHQWISQDIVYGTCTEDGYINFKCGACGMEAVFDNTCETYPNEYLGTIIDAAVAAALPSKGAHKWETELPYGANAIIQNGYVIYVDKAATCGAAGRGRMLCTECGKYSEYVSINKTAHNLKTMAAVAPTCQTPGHEAYQVCRNCPYSEEIVKIPALGHNDANNNGKCDLCGFEMYETDSGSKGCGCMCHSNSWFIAKLIYPIVRFFWKIFGMKHTCNCGAEHY